MEKRLPFAFTRPYDLRERLFEYACAIVYVTQYLHTKGDVARTLADQILRAGNSAGANHEEADDGSSPEYDPVIEETLELKRTMASLIRRSTPKRKTD